MKSLKDYKETIHKCSKCGLCQSVCPIYQVTGNECSVSRGLFIMLQGVIKGDLKWGAGIRKHLKTCLKCGKCTDFCPSGIDVVQVLTAAEHENFKRTVFKFLPLKFCLNTCLNMLKVLFGKQKKRVFKSEKKVIYFGGCVEKINPKTSEYSKDILNKLGYEIIDIEFNCCGLPFLTSGNLKQFETQMNENISKIIDMDFEYFVTDCASCEWQWREYSNYIEDDIIKAKFERIKFKNIYEIILESNLEFVSNRQFRITYHMPCHEKNDIPEQLISKLTNLQYDKLDTKEQCCGFSNLLSNDIATKRIRSEKKSDINNINADFVLTTCIGCVFSLNLLLQNNKTLRLIDFLRKYFKFK